MIPLVFFWALVDAVASPRPAQTRPAQTCRACHQRLSPVQLRIYDDSAHAAAGLGCQSCHGADETGAHAKDRAPVDATVCGRCHAQALKQHQRGKHGVGFRAGRACTRNSASGERIQGDCLSCHEPDTARPRQRAECARFLAQTPAMQRQGCLACHKIEQRCDSCHGSHDTRGQVARAPGTCGSCHMGPDHAQLEMWRSSRHGVLFGIDGESGAPSCVTCHMAGKDHDVSRGISMGLGGQTYAAAERQRQRALMLTICQGCHAPGFSRRQLADADRIQAESKKVIDQARVIVERLHREGLLQPAVDQRPPHPLAGARLELGSQMLYQDLSRAEAIFFRMKKFYYVSAYKGAFHQNPDYTHWYGNAPLRLALSELRSEAALLRKIAADDKGRDARPDPKSPLHKALRELQERHRRGELDDRGYRHGQGELLKKYGL